MRTEHIRDVLFIMIGSKREKNIYKRIQPGITHLIDEDTKLQYAVMLVIGIIPQMIDVTIEGYVTPIPPRV